MLVWIRLHAPTAPLPRLAAGSVFARARLADERPGRLPFARAASQLGNRPALWYAPPRPRRRAAHGAPSAFRAATAAAPFPPGSPSCGLRQCCHQRQHAPTQHRLRVHLQKAGTGAPRLVPAQAVVLRRRQVACIVIRQGNHKRRRQRAVLFDEQPRFYKYPTRQSGNRQLPQRRTCTTVSTSAGHSVISTVSWA